MILDGSDRVKRIAANHYVMDLLMLSKSKKANLLSQHLYFVTTHSADSLQVSHQCRLRILSEDFLLTFTYCE